VGVVEGRPRAEEGRPERRHTVADGRPSRGAEEQGGKRGGQENREEGEQRQRKMSRLEREEELVRRAMRKTTRKVRRRTKENIVQRSQSRWWF
jgi:hypothetical protein